VERAAVEPQHDRQQDQRRDELSRGHGRDCTMSP
jgi:hypothetical protein